MAAGCASSEPTAIPLAYWPTLSWHTSSPEAQGMDSSILASMLREIENEKLNLHGLLIVRNGTIVSETYFDPYTEQTAHDVASVTKSVMGTLIGIAIGQEIIQGVDIAVPELVDAGSTWSDPSAWSDLTLRHLLTLQTGLECDLESTESAMVGSENWVSYLLQLPFVSEPGTTWYYCSPAVHLLSAAIHQQSQSTAREFANEHLFAPLGIAAVSAKAWFSDPQGLSRGDIGLSLTPREMAKIGLLYLQDGVWDGVRLLPSSWVQTASSPLASKGDGTAYGYLWTVYPDEDHYAALGRGGQQLHIFPSKNLIVAVTAALPAYADSDQLNHLLREFILPAVAADSPLPENPAAAQELAALESEMQAPHPMLNSAPAVTSSLTPATFNFDPNDAGWNTFTLEFPDNPGIARAVLNDQLDYHIGMDGRCRLNLDPSGQQVSLCGGWADPETLVVRMATLGTAEEAKYTMTFHADQIEVHAEDNVFGTYAFDLHGTRVR